MERKVKGIHDITTSLCRAKAGEKKEILKIRRLSISLGGLPDRRKRFSKQGEEIITPPRVWAFSTRPKFRRYQKSIEKTLLIERVEEPKTNVFEKMDNLVIMAELPEVKKEDIHWEVSSDIFTLCAQDKFSSRKYVKEMLLPFVVDGVNIQTDYRDGIFEISFRRKRGTKK
jgi:HSP20 family molecular chaperone IbpA